MIYLNDHLINPTIFPDNTSQIWKLPDIIFDQLDKDGPHIEIKWAFDSEGEFMHLAQIKDLLKRYQLDVSLNLIYLPYGRQDKEISNSSTFALHTFAHLLNSLNFDIIRIQDPHSYIATTLIKNSIPYYPDKIITKILLSTNSDLVTYPDKGAHEKYSKIYDYEYIYGEKVRDQSTGNINSYKLIGSPLNRNILIIDDICDGGMTFKILAKDLLDAGAKEVNLFVTHGIFSKGIKTLKESGINRIFTADGEVEEIHNGFTYRRL